MIALPWWVASLVSNVAIIFIEYTNRQADDGWMSVLPQTAIPIIIAQWCLFHGFGGAPHWMIAWVFFALGNSVMRVAAIHFLSIGEIGSWPVTLSGVTIMMIGAFVVKEGLR